MRSPGQHARSLHAARLAATAILLAAALPRLQAQVVPSVGFITPASVSAGDPAFTLAVIGNGFVNGATVWWNSTQLPGTLLGPNQLSASVPANLISAQGIVQISVSNPGGAQSNFVQLTILPPSLAVAAVQLPAASVGAPYSATLSALGGVPPYTWFGDSLPSGFSLSAAGVLSGTPTQSGTLNLLVRVTDGSQPQRSASRTLTLTVNPPQLAIVTPQTLPPATAGTAYSTTMLAQNGTAPLNWTLGPGAPGGFTLNAATGILSGTPLLRGSYTFTISVVDANRIAVNRAFTLVVQPPPLTITTLSPLFSGTTGTVYSQTFSASGGTPPYVWSMSPEVAGLTLDPNTGVLTGTPQTAATYTFTLQIRDGEGNAVSRSFSLTVEQPRVTIAVSVLPAGTVGVAYSTRLLASGGTAPYLWSVLAGGVPGLSLNAVTGILGDTPASPGTFNITVQVRDAAGLTAAKSFPVSIAPGALRIAPAQQAFTATILSPFRASITASGGTPPYTWSANGLPPGLSMNPASGEISGAPSAAGTFQFTVRVSDATAGAQADTELFQIVVGFPPLPALSVLNLPETADPASQPAFRLQLESGFAVPISGQLMLAFSPESGGGDAAVQFATGGRTLDFTIPAGATEAEFAAPPALQTGTVAGTLLLTARLRASGADITPTPLQVKAVRVERAAPAIRRATFSRSATGLEIQITGYSTAREVTQAVFRFSAASGSTLRTSEVAVAVEAAFSGWFNDRGVADFGSQFTFTQTFAIDGSAAAVSPVSVTLTNRLGSTTAQIAP